MPGHDHEPPRVPEQNDGWEADGVAGREGRGSQGEIPLRDCIRWFEGKIFLYLEV